MKVGAVNAIQMPGVSPVQVAARAQASNPVADLYRAAATDDGPQAAAELVARSSSTPDVPAPPLTSPVQPFTPVEAQLQDTTFASPASAGSSDWPIVAALAQAAFQRAGGSDAPAGPAPDVTPGMVARAYAQA